MIGLAIGLVFSASMQEGVMYSRKGKESTRNKVGRGDVKCLGVQSCVVLSKSKVGVSGTLLSIFLYVCSIGIGMYFKDLLGFFFLYNYLFNILT